MVSTPSYNPRLPRGADTLVYLSIPLWKRLLNHLERLSNRRCRRDQMTFQADIEFFIEMLKPDAQKVESMERLLQQYQEKVVVLKSRKDMRSYIASL